MGQKIHPVGFRVGITRDWESRWFAPKKLYGQLAYEDYLIRKAIKERWYNAGIARIEIERAAVIKVIIYAARPGQLIGRGGKGIEEISQTLQHVLHPYHPDVRLQIDIQDVRIPEVEAQLVAENIAQQLEKRISHRRAIRQAITRAQRYSVKGIKIQVAGRLGGAEIARTESERVGRAPLHTLRADIDYGQATAFTIYGTVGVKVWIYKGEVHRLKPLHEGVHPASTPLEEQEPKAPSAESRSPSARGRRRRRTGTQHAVPTEHPSSPTASQTPMETAEPDVTDIPESPES